MRQVHAKLFSVKVESLTLKGKRSNLKSATFKLVHVQKSKLVQTLDKEFTTEFKSIGLLYS